MGSFCVQSTLADVRLHRQRLHRLCFFIISFLVKYVSKPEYIGDY